MDTVLIVDEAHEYKNQGSAQGQAMGVLSSLVKKERFGPIKTIRKLMNGIIISIYQRKQESILV